MAYDPKSLIILQKHFPLIQEVSNLKNKYLEAVTKLEFPEDKNILDSLDLIIKRYSTIFADSLNPDSEISCMLDFTFIESYIKAIYDLLSDQKPIRKRRNLDGVIYSFMRDYGNFIKESEEGTLLPATKAQKQALFFTDIDSFKYDKLNYIHTIFLDLKPPLDKEKTLASLRNQIKSELVEKYGNFQLSPNLNTRAGVKRKLVENEIEMNKMQKTINDISDLQSNLQDPHFSRTPRNVDSTTEKMDVSEVMQLQFISKNLSALIKALSTALSLEIDKIFEIFNTGSVQELNSLCNTNFLDIDRKYLNGKRTKLSIYSDKIEGQELITIIFCSKLKCYRLIEKSMAFQISTGQYCLEAEKLFNNCYKCLQTLTLNPPDCDTALKPSENCAFEEIDYISAKPFLINGNTALMFPTKNLIIQNIGNKNISHGNYHILDKTNSLKVGREENLTFFLENFEITKLFDMKDSFFSKVVNFITDTQFYDEIIYTSSALSAIGIIISIIQFTYFSLLAKKSTNSILTCTDTKNKDIEMMPLRKKTRFKIVRNNMNE